MIISKWDKSRENGLLHILLDQTPLMIYMSGFIRALSSVHVQSVFTVFLLAIAYTLNDFKEARKGFLPITMRFEWRKIKTLLSLSEEQCFVIWIKLLSSNFLRVFAMPWRLPWQRYNASKRPFETQFFQNNSKTNSVT